MKKLLALCTGLFLLGIWNHAACQNPTSQIPNPKSAWFDFLSAEGKFSVLLPAAPIGKTTTTATAIGEIQYHTFAVQQNDGPETENLLYLVSYCDYPAGSVHSDSSALLGEFFAATVEESTKSIAGALVYAADFWFAEFPGKVWRVDYNKGAATVRTKSFVVRNRVYTLQTACRREQSLNSASEKFFGSFKLLPG